jgi:hypothetical protein
MTKKQTFLATLVAVLVLPFFAAIATPQATSAYTCAGKTGNTQHTYQDGACFNGTNLVPNEKPVKNDGTAITEWECASGQYDAAQHACTPRASIKPMPKGADTTTAPTGTGNGSTTGNTDGSGEGECAGVKTDFFACDGEGLAAIGSILKLAILIFSIGVGIVAVGGIVYGAVLYASAQDNQQQVTQSRKIIRNVVIGLILYTFMVAILNWIVPGGVIGGASPAPAPAGGTNNPQNSQTPTN